MKETVKKNYQELIDKKDVRLIQKAIKIMKCENIDLKREIEESKKIMSANKGDIKCLESALLGIKGANKMEAVGLIPSTTGKEGGKK